MWLEAAEQVYELEEIDFLTQLKWTFALLLPELAEGDVGVYLYEGQDIKDADLEDKVAGQSPGQVLFAWEKVEGDETIYKAIPIKKVPSNETPTDKGKVSASDYYLAVTTPIQGQDPVKTLKGKLP